MGVKFFYENFVIQLRAKNQSGVFLDPPVPRRLKEGWAYQRIYGTSSHYHTSHNHISSHHVIHLVVLSLLMQVHRYSFYILNIGDKYIYYTLFLLQTNPSCLGFSESVVSHSVFIFSGPKNNSFFHLKVCKLYPRHNSPIQYRLMSLVAVLL